MTVQKILRWWIAAFLFLPALAAAQIGPGTQVTVAGTVTTIPASLTFPTQAITAQDTGSTSTTQADGQAAITGTPTAGSVATFTVPGGYGTASVVITGTFTGTTTIEVSRDGGTTYIAKGAHLIGSTITAASYIAPFQAEGSIVGVTNIRVRATATWSGTATVRVIVTGLVEQIYVGNQVIIANPVTGFLGNLVLSAATSTAVNTLTLGPNSGAFPTTIMNTMFFLNAGANLGYICPYGGSCGTTGFPLAAGASKTFNLGASTVVPTAYSPLGTTFTITN